MASRTNSIRLGYFGLWCDLAFFIDYLTELEVILAVNFKNIDGLINNKLWNEVK